MSACTMYFVFLEAASKQLNVYNYNYGVSNY